MNKKKTDKDWEEWQQYIVLFIVMGLLIIWIYFFPDSVFRKEVTGTKGKVFQYFLKYLSIKLGLEYVYGFLSIIMTIAGIKAFIGYSKRNENR